MISVPLAVQVAIILTYGTLADRGYALNLQQYHEKEIIGRINWLSTVILSASLSAISGSLTHQNWYSGVFAASKQKAETEFRTLKQLLKDDQKQLQKIEAIEQKWLELKAILDQQNAQSDKALIQLLASASIQALCQELYNQRSVILREETTRFPMSKSDAESDRARLRTQLNELVLLDILAALVLFRIFSLQIVRRVAKVTDNSLRLAEGKPLNQPLDGKDEIQVLDQNFHNMAAQLKAARMELEASERRIKTILNNVPNGVVVLRPDLTVEFANLTVEGLFKHQLVGKKAGELFKSDYSPEEFSQFVNSQCSLMFSEVDACRADGTTFRAELGSNHVEFHDGERTLLSIKDVTERYELERMKRDFIAMVCHDLRNPLNSIQLFHEMLERQAFGPMTEAGTKLLKNVRSSTDNLMRLTNDMLESERLEQAGVELVLANVKLDAIIEQAIASTDGATSSKQITVDYQPVDVELVCDEIKILRVISNLVGNAAKFSPKKTRITIRAEIQESSEKEADSITTWKANGKISSMVRISVKDEGRGIPDEMIGSIFDKFKQVTTNDARIGSGLGLSICKQFVEKHGGQIGVLSETGKGSTFWFTLPVSFAGSS
jgi:PAS domain S-box-containing protein